MKTGGSVALMANWSGLGYCFVVFDGVEGLSGGGFFWDAFSEGSDIDVYPVVRGVSRFSVTAG